MLFRSGLLALRWPLAIAYLAACAGVIGVLGGRLGTEIFPKADNGQFALRLRAPSGTQVDRTEALAKQVLAAIGREAGGDDRIEVSIGMVGVHNSSFPVNLVHLWNGGPEEGWLAVQFKAGSGVRIEAFKERLRGVFAREFPEVRFSFEPQDIVSRVMSFGSPTPVEIAISGSSLPVSKEYADRIITRLKEVPCLRDIQIAQTLDYPTVAVNVDRERAGLLGVRVSDVTRSLVAATTSSRFTTPIFSTFAEFVVGLREYGALIKKEDAKLRAGLSPSNPDKPFLDFRKWPLEGAKALDPHTLEIRIKGKYPQWNYWMQMTFMAPVPWEADAFYAQPGMASVGLSLDRWPVGTGPYMMEEDRKSTRLNSSH